MRPATMKVMGVMVLSVSQGGSPGRSSHKHMTKREREWAIVADSSSNDISSKTQCQRYLLRLPNSGCFLIIAASSRPEG